jgi:hypothetical protein
VLSGLSYQLLLTNTTGTIPGLKMNFTLYQNILFIEKNIPIINIEDNNNVHYYKRERSNNNKIDSISKNTDDDKTNNIGSPLKL